MMSHHATHIIDDDVMTGFCVTMMTYARANVINFAVNKVSNLVRRVYHLTCSALTENYTF